MRPLRAEGDRDGLHKRVTCKRQHGLGSWAGTKVLTLPSIMIVIVSLAVTCLGSAFKEISLIGERMK